MIFETLGAGLLLGLDSLLVCGAAGTCADRRMCRWLPAGFAVCDGLASWLGAQIWQGQRPDFGGWLGPAAVACYGVYLLVLAWVADWRRQRAWWPGLLLPLLLSIDNFAAASELPLVVTAPTAVLMGCISGALAAVGAATGAAVGAKWGRRRGWLAGASLCLLAMLFAVRDALS